MANPQVEQGHTRLANKIDEAIIAANFTAAQAKIVRCVIRLTFGWRRRTVRIAQADLARKCRVSPRSGGWKRALDLLLANAVLVEVEPPIGRRAGAYALNKNYERWGIYSVPRALLDVEFKDRPEHVDDVPRAIARLRTAATETPQEEMEFDRDLDPEPPPDSPETDGAGEVRRGAQEGPSTTQKTARRGAQEGESTNRRGAQEGALRGPGGSIEGPTWAPIDPSKSLNGNDSQPPTAINRQDRQTATARDAAAATVGSTEFESKLANGAIDAVRRRWPLASLNVRQAGALTADLMSAGVDLDLALQTIRTCAARKLGDAPASIAYFRARILDAHRDAAHDATKAEANGAAPRQRRRQAPTPLADVLAQTDAVDVQYREARRAAAATWANDPPNAAAYFKILDAANKRFDGLLSADWGVKGRDEDVVEHCAEAAKFPDRANWKPANPSVKTSEPIQAGTSEPTISPYREGES